MSLRQTGAMANRLDQSTSPYLQQHADKAMCF